jgi:1-phosphatidylinositol phosphodiesterase
MLALCGLGQPAQAHNDSAYSHDARISYNHADWMSSLPGTVHLKDLSMVGTHDSMSFYGGDIVQTQSMSLATQLAAGVRVLDIRCRRIDNQFAIHHGFVYQHANFDDVLTTVTQFLAQHPSETVLMRLSEEYDAANSSLSFGQIFANYVNKPAYNQYFWKDSNPNPTLAATRGKLVIFNNFSGNNFGLNYGSIDKQDDYNVGTNWDLYSKWSKVKNQINHANASNAATSGFFMNYLSASGGSFPYFIVSGHSSPGTSAPRLATGLTTPGWRSSYPDFPRVNCFIGICTIAFEGTNTLTANYIANNRPGFVGIIMTDFPGLGLIDKVIGLNANAKR